MVHPLARLAIGLFKHAGLLTIGWEAVDTGKRPLLEPSYYLHLGVYLEHWVWGKKHEYEGLYSFGLGPFFLYCWG